ncbi:MAG: hypothetical protein K8S13_16760 [Desulfobacula sp.]|uniref:substrate-binding periplasmic protein n=1 Tax=Desulfobacula sp. TaxID=2593537 RepID=UPI0025C59C07|nr:hypothetical protein [Desulfobacula sp.]MCD4721492.1 hypothetical protein [Desulfobacula sp.]
MKQFFIFLFFIFSFVSVSSALEIEKVEFSCVNKKDSRLYKISDAILTHAFKNLGIKFGLKVLPPKRIPREINIGKIDGDTHRIYDFNREKKYQNLIRVEESIQMITQSVFTKLDNIKVNGWKSLSSYKILYLSGIKVTENGMDVAGIPSENRLGVYDIDNAFYLLNLGRGDIAIVSPSTGRASLKKLGISNNSIKMLTPPVVTINLYPYMHKKYAVLAKKLAGKLKEMKENGKYDEIINTIQE